MLPVSVTGNVANTGTAVVVGTGVEASVGVAVAVETVASDVGQGILEDVIIAMGVVVFGIVSETSVGVNVAGGTDTSGVASPAQAPSSRISNKNR
jgi:hypothetical protein